MVTIGRNERAPIPATLVFIGACVRRSFHFHPAPVRSSAASPKKATSRSLTHRRAAHSLRLWVAQEAGLFKKHGLDATFKASQLASRAASAGRRRGRCDLFGPGSRQCAAAKRSGEVHRRLAATLYLSIMGRKGRSDTLADLKGKIIAVTTPRTSTEIAAREAIKKTGVISEKDVSFVYVQTIPCHSDRDDQRQDFSRNPVRAEYFEGARRRTQLC